MIYKDIKMEERPENEPKFNGKNKTDRKIMITVISLIAVLLVLVVGFIILYYTVFYGGNAGIDYTSSSQITSISNLMKK